MKFTILEKTRYISEERERGLRMIPKSGIINLMHYARSYGRKIKITCTHNYNV
jgi:hypothetical protein